MPMFAVVLNEPNDAVAERIRAAWPEPEHIAVGETVYLVAGDMPIDTVLEKAGLIGASPVEGATGFALQMSGTYGGRAHKTIWDWFDRAADRQLATA